MREVRAHTRRRRCQTQGQGGGGGQASRGRGVKDRLSTLGEGVRCRACCRGTRGGVQTRAVSQTGAEGGGTWTAADR